MDDVGEQAALTSEEAKAILENLVTDNDGNASLGCLEAVIDRFNIFEAIGAVRQELRHSDFLSFLLNPNENHGLGDVFLKSVLREARGTDPGSSPAYDLIDLDVWNLEDTEVRREWHGIDILLLSPANKLAVIIENKVDSGEQLGQLRKYVEEVKRHYRRWKLHPIFLTPDGRQPSHDSYLALDYGAVAGIISEILKRRASTLGADITTLLGHYEQMLGRHIVSESDVAKLCRSIYAKHRRALDLLFEHRPDVQSAIRDLLVKLIKDDREHGLILDRQSKTWISFTTKELDPHIPKSTNKWSVEGRVLMFSFTNSPGSLGVMLEIGPGPKEIRKRLFEIAKRREPPFTCKKKTQTEYFTRIFSRSLVNYTELDAESVLKAMKDNWSAFLKDDLPQITSIFSRELQDEFVPPKESANDPTA